MRRFLWFNSFFPFSLFLLISKSFPGPRIEFDAKTINCGTILEDKTEKIDAKFIVRNTGDSPLKIESVRPGCGCTVVKFDSVIEPGKISKIESQVRVKGFRAGPLSKSITVISNAENENEVRLTINATIKSIIGASEGYINLASPDTSSPRTIFLTSLKKDLSISSVSFVVDENNGAAVWEGNIKIPIRFDFHLMDSITTDSSRVYKLNLYPPAFKKASEGTLTVTTNHKDKKELSLRGRIGW